MNIDIIIIGIRPVKIVGAPSVTVILGTVESMDRIKKYIFAGLESWLKRLRGKNEKKLYFAVYTIFEL